MTWQVQSQFLSQGQLTLGPVAGIPFFIDASAATPGQLYSFSPGDAVIDQIGGGRAADLVLGFLSQSGSPCYFSPATPTWTALPAITHVGSGPTVTAALAGVAGASGPLDFFHILVTITAGGVSGAGATFSAAYDYQGSTVIDTFPVPPETPALLVGTVPLTPSSLALAPGLTLVFVTPAVETLTLASPSLSASSTALMAATATVTGGASYTSANYLAPGIATIALNPRKISFTTGGSTPAHVPSSIALSGFDYAGNAISETITPDTSAGTVFSTKVYASFSWSYASAGGTDATLAVGYSTAYATNAELVAEIDALAVAAPLTVSATTVQTATGTYLELYTNLATSGAGGTGTSAEISLNASPGTAASLFGFANSASAFGLAATFTPPNTNVTLTFTVGTVASPYIEGDTYALTCTGPTASTSAVTSVITNVARPNWKTNQFGAIYVLAEPSSAINAAGLQTACTALANTYRADNSMPVAIFTNTCLHTASQVSATNAANITANDNAISAAFSANAAALDTVVHDDCFFPGAPQLRAGVYRRPAIIGAAIKVAVLPFLGANLGNGNVPGLQMRGPDLLTYARDEATAVTKLGPTGPGQTGLGFTVLTTSSDVPAQAKFVSGVTRAGNGSNFRYCGAVFVALFISQTGYAIAAKWVGQQWPTSQVQQTLGQLRQDFATHQANIVYQALKRVLVDANPNQPSVSTLVQTTITTAGIDFQSTGIAPLVMPFVPLAEVQQVLLIVIANASAPQPTTTGLSP
jgi:hypothetical protein